MTALLSEFVSYVIIYVMTVAFAVAGVLLGINLKKKKNSED